jgi:cell division protein FtsB
MLGNLFAPLGMKIAGGIALALAIALGVVMWRADAISDDRERLRNALATEEARHAVTRQSVGTLEAVIADLNEQAEQRAEVFAEAQELAQEREKELAAARIGSERVIARLRALAATKGQCAVPDDLRELADGL